MKRDLSDSPGELPVDGSAHIIKDRGFLFLFTVGGTSVRASIPINRWLQLEEDPDALYQIKEVYPREGTDLGIYKYGAEFLYGIPTVAAVILSLEPAAKGSTPRPSDLLNQGKPVVIPAFSSADPAKSRDANSWHWPFDELIEDGAATPDASPNKAHARLSGQELCEGAVGNRIVDVLTVPTSLQASPEATPFPAIRPLFPARNRAGPAGK